MAYKPPPFELINAGGAGPSRKERIEKDNFFAFAILTILALLAGAVVVGAKVWPTLVRGYCHFFCAIPL